VKSLRGEICFAGEIRADGGWVYFTVNAANDFT
jgi:hypothetical protein